MMPGTRFRLYPQFASGYAVPERVVLSCPLGSVGPGPADDTMYVVHPREKTEPYDPPHYMPPYRGAMLAPACPDASGHFDCIPEHSPEFAGAHLFACARRALDVWEHYLERPVVWWHTAAYPRIELIPDLRWDNAQSGPGFIETGARVDERGNVAPFCLNFDVIAHEIGHAVLFSEIGVPATEHLTGQFLAFHESFSDMVALVGTLHFDSVVDRLLTQTDGNLYVLNLVSRIGEISDLAQIRTADNAVKMQDVADLRLMPDGSWTDPTGQDRNAHHLAQPLTGAIFDALVDLYQDGLVRRGAIAPHLDTRTWRPEEVEASLDWVHQASAQQFARFADAFRASLLEARNTIGACIAHVMTTLDPTDLAFDRVAARFLEALVLLGRGDQVDAFLDDFLWRGIDPRPILQAERLPTPGEWRRLPYAEKVRRVAAAKGVRDCRCAHASSFIAARRLMPHLHRSSAPERVTA
jgi:hypothetical protein